MNRLIAVVLGVAGMTFIASASPVYFTDDAFDGAAGNRSFKCEEYGITLSASPKGAVLTRGDAGIGIDYKLLDQTDEIDYPETLTIEFDKNVDLESVYISKLFHDEAKFLWWTIASWDEEGTYKLNTGEVKNFVTENNNGELTLNINKTVKSIKLYAKDECLASITNDFSVRGVNCSSVPEPAMLSFLGFSLLGMGLLRFRKK